MPQYKERPRCRKELERRMREEKITLTMMLTNYGGIHLSYGMRCQARKMMDEMTKNST